MTFLCKVPSNLLTCASRLILSVKVTVWVDLVNADPLTLGQTLQDKICHLLLWPAPSAFSRVEAVYLRGKSIIIRWSVSPLGRPHALSEAESGLCRTFRQLCSMQRKAPGGFQAQIHQTFCYKDQSKPRCANRGMRSAALTLWFSVLVLTIHDLRRDASCCDNAS